jgi:transcriptional regulator with XRE-family HTH domain
MEAKDMSLREVCRQADISPAFLSRILSGERGLPSDEVIIRVAEALDIEPPERLLIEAGRTGDNLKDILSKPHVPDLLRALGPLTEAQRKELLDNARAVLLKHHRKKKTK